MHAHAHACTHAHTRTYTHTHTRRIVVSAPMHNIPGAAVENTGAVFTCTVGTGSCSPLTGNGVGTDNRLYDMQGELYIATECLVVYWSTCFLLSEGHLFKSTIYKAVIENSIVNDIP